MKIEPWGWFVHPNLPGRRHNLFWLMSDDIYFDNKIID